MAANIIIMGVWSRMALVWSMLQDPKCLALCWHLFLRGGNDIVTAISAQKAANLMIIARHHRTALEISMRHEQNSLTLWWCSFLGGSSYMVIGLGAHKGCQHCHYGFMLSRSSVIIQVARQEIGHSPLTIICRMGQQFSCLPFCI